MSRNRYHMPPIMLFMTMLFAAPSLAAPPVPAPPIKEQPISIYADRLSIDDATGVSLYRGDVELQQGALKFSGDELEITQKEGTVILMQARGRPAHFSRSGPEPLKAKASRIDYDNKKGEVILRGEAQLWQNGDQFSGELIHYYIDSRRVQAQGGSQGQQGSGRVHVLIQPKEGRK